MDKTLFIAAANQNQSVLEYRAGSDWWSGCWTEEAIARNPPLRTEFEHAIVFGSFAEALSMRAGKSGWGRLINIEPLRPDDFLHPTRITYQLKSSSKMRQRWEFRDSFKQILGSRRCLVTEAMRFTKRRFLNSVNESDTRIIRQKLNLSPVEFWRAVRNGERYGENGIHKFVKELKERTEGYEFDFTPGQESPEFPAIEEPECL